ncbi:MAG: hypothetical protein HYX87_07005 [Chloroflexi bacterium]|nr:hypothetical protein [Chloroflexota bacterium]
MAFDGRTISVEATRSATDAWRQAIGYINDSNPLTKPTATIDDIRAAAQDIYHNHPELLKAVREFLD